MTTGDARPLDGGVIGNCGFGALIDPRGRICWACLPHFDGDPVFHSLLGGSGTEDGDPEAGGFFDVLLEGFRESEQQYLENTAILVTTLRDSNGAAVRITDFAPRFEQFGRSFRPTMIVRTIERLSGEPRIRIRLRPRFDYGARRPEVTRGSNHVRYVGPALTLRLTTDAPVSLISDEISFVLEQPLTLLLGPDESLTEPVDSVAREFRSRTETWWREFVRHLAVPFEWQEAVIRAAITLQLCSFEETGAVLAAMTTSIPEAPDSGRNWDYRFCWLRDSHFVVQALNRLGATRTMEGYLGYITNLAAAAEGGGAAAGLRHQVRAGAHRAHHRRPAGLSRHAAGAGRQRRLASAPERQLRQRDPLRHPELLRPTAGQARQPPRVRLAGAARRPGRGPVRPARRRPLGVPATKRRPHVLERHVLGSLRPPGPHRESARPGRSSKALDEPGRGDPFARPPPRRNRRRGPCRHAGGRRHRRQPAPAPRSGLPRRRRPLLRGHRRVRRAAALRQQLLPLPGRTTSAPPPPPSPSAASGTSTRSTPSGAARRPANCSSRCSNAATRWDFSPRTSTRRPANSGATSPRPTRWSA